MASRVALYSEHRATTAKNIEGSLHFTQGDSNHLTWVPGGTGNTRQMTFSFWHKRSEILDSQYFITAWNGSNTDRIGLTGDDQLHIEIKDGGSTECELHTDLQLMDVQGWYHIVVAFDTDHMTTADRVKVYINGERVTTFDTNDTMGEHYDMEGFNVCGMTHSIGRYQSDNTTGGSSYLHGFLSDFHFIDGVQLEASDFGYTDPTTNTWRPKAYEYKTTADLTSTSYAIKSSEQSSDGQIATNVFDSATSDAFASRWRNNGSEDSNIVNNAYIGQDFGSGNKKHIREVRLLQGRASSTGEMVTGVKVQYSDNGSSWSDAGSAHTIDASTFAWQTIKVASTGAHQYWRLLCSASSNSVWLVTEMTMHEYTNIPYYGSNGWYLPFDGSAPVGEDRSGQVNPNDGTNWSSKHSGTIYGGAATDVFDGTDLTDKASVNSSDAAQNHFTLSSLSVTAKSIRVFVSNCASNVEVSINGSVVGTISSSDIGSGSRGEGFKFSFTEAVVTSIKVRRVSSTSGWFLYGIQLDDIDLVDDKFGNNWTPKTIDTGKAGVGGLNSVSLDRATGALPILNTVCGGAVATVGVRTDADAPGQLVYANPFCGISTDVAHKINGGVSAHPLSMTGSLPGTDQNRLRADAYNNAFYLDGNDCVYAPDSADWTMGSGDWTAEIWLKRNRTGADEWVFTHSDGTTANTPFGIHIDSSTNFLEGRAYTSSDIDFAGTTAMVANVWYHCALVRDGSVLRLFLNGIQENTSAISGSLLDGSSSLLVGAVTSAGSAGFQGWVRDARLYKGVAKYKQNFIPPSMQPSIVKMSPSSTIHPYESDTTLNGRECGSISLDATDDDITWSHGDFSFGSGDFTMECWFYVRKFQAQHMTIISNYTDGSTQGNFIELYANGEVYIHLWAPSNTHHDTGARVGLHKWHHVALVREGTGSGEMHCYLDGKKTPNSMQESTDFGSGAKAFRIGALDGSATYDFDGFISNVRVVKGTAVYTSDFTPSKEPLTNIANTVLLTCQSPKHIEHSVSPAAPTVNGSPRVSSFNPFKCNTEARPGNYPRMNFLSASDVKNGSIRNGNWIVEGNNYVKQQSEVRFGPGYTTSGKYYWEITWRNGTFAAYGGITADFEQDSGEIASASGKNWMGSTSYKPYNTSSSTSDSTIGGYDGQTYGYAIDLDAQTMQFLRDGHLVWTDTTIPDADTTQFQPMVISTNDGASGANWPDAEFNFGQNAFRFPPPVGYKSLNYANLIRSESNQFVRPDKYFGTLLYEGTGAVQTRTGLNFQPDMVWIKNRDDTDQHVIQDSVRGNWVYYPDSDSGGGSSGGGWVKSMFDGGFAIDVNGPINENNESMVAWCWKAGGNKGTFTIDDIGHSSAAAAGLTGGDLDPSAASIGTKNGFSIITYTGNGSSNQSIKHGLTKAPEIMIIKRFGGTGYWDVTYTHGDGTFDFLKLDEAEAKADITGRTAPTSSLMYVSGAGSNDANGETYCAYSWHSVPGLQHFASYYGNGSSTDGPYVHLGFKPGLVIIKDTSAGNSWCMYDTKRDTVNPGNTLLQSHDTAADAAYGGIDFLADGFKIRSSVQAINSDGSVYIYMAWAEESLNTLYGGQSNAR